LKNQLKELAVALDSILEKEKERKTKKYGIT
jgi:hypothetical protein